MIKACLFDLDGTLLDTLTTITYYCNLSLENFGFETIDKEECKYMVGSGAKKLVERMLEKIGEYNEQNYHKVYKYYMENYDANPSYLTEPYDGICDMLAELKQMGIKVGVISNKPHFATTEVCKEKIDASLTDCVRGQIEGVKIKPDPEGPMAVLETLGADGAECVYIGDTSVDMHTGKNIGAYTVGVSWGFRSTEELRASGADAIISHPGELLDIIKNINKNF